MTHTNAASLPRFRNFGLTFHYWNIPSTQRRAQHIAAQFNAAEELWRSLAANRLGRRELCPDLSPDLQIQLDVLDFANAQFPQDCIGFVVEP